MKRFFSTATLLAAIFLSVQGVISLSANPPHKWTEPTWKVAKDQYTVIAAIDPTAKKVSLHHVGGKDKEDRVVMITAFTDIVVNDKKATVADLKPGMRVDYTLGGDGTSLDRLETLAIQTPAPTPVPTATPSFPKGGKH